MSDKPFDKLLIAYQRLTLCPIIASLLGVISSFLSYFGVENGGALAPGLSLWSSAKFDSALTGLLLSFLLSFLYIPFALFAAKGKLPFYLALLSFLAVDLVFSALAPKDGAEGWIALSFHIAVLLLGLAGLIIYFLAKRALANEKRGQ